MDYHHHARLTVVRREELAKRVLEGRLSLKEAEADRSSRPRRSPRGTSKEKLMEILPIIGVGAYGWVFTSMALQRKFIRLPKVIETTGLSRSSIYRRLDSGDFPRPVRLGSKSVAWIEEEVQAWMDKLASDRGTLTV